jgi:hypothetical protein
MGFRDLADLEEEEFLQVMWHIMVAQQIMEGLLISPYSLFFLLIILPQRLVEVMLLPQPLVAVAQTDTYTEAVVLEEEHQQMDLIVGLVEMVEMVM